MWIEDIWNAPLFWWLLLILLGGGIVLLVRFLRCRKPDPIKEHMDYYCQCYAKGEISEEDFEELKRDLQKFKKPNNQQKE